MMVARIFATFLLSLVLAGTNIGVAASPNTVTRVHIYLVALGGAGSTGPRIGCGDRLVAVTRPISPTVAPLTAAIRQLLRIHQRLYGRSGLYNALYRSQLHLRSAVLKHGNATIRLRGRLNLGGECDDPRVVAQLRYTVLQFRAIHRATILINRVPLKRLLSGKG